jgi:hypothetical protein
MALSKRARVGAGLGLIASLMAIAGLCFAPLVRSRVESEARRRDLEISLEGVRPGWFSIVLRGIRVRPAGVPGVEVEIPRATLELTATLSPKELLLEGGRVSLTGTVEDLKARILEWRSRRVPGEGPHRVLGIHAAQMAAHWDAGSGGKADALGLEIDRDETGVRATCERADMLKGPLGIGLEGAALVLDGAWTLKSLKLTRADVTYSERSGSSDGAMMASPPATGDLAPPPLPTAPAKGRRKGAKATEEAAPTAEASVPLLPMPNLQSWRASAAVLATLMTQRLPEGATVTIEGVRLRLEEGGEERISLGPGPLEVEREGARVEVTFSTGQTAAGTPMSLHALLPSDDSDVEVSLAGGPVPLSLLGLRAKALTDLDRATLTGKGRVVLDGKAKTLTFDGQLTFRGLVAHDPRLAAETVRGLDFDARVRGVLSDRGELRLDEAEAAMGALRMSAHGGFEQTADHVSAA